MAPTTLHRNGRAKDDLRNAAQTALLFNGTELLIRPVSPADFDREASFLKRLPPECRGFRFLGLVHQNGAAASALTEIDPEIEVSLIGIVREKGEDIEVGAARFCADRGGTRCDCAVAVDPAWQDVGVGSALMQQLIAAARRRGIRRMYAVDPTFCRRPHWLASHLGFRPRIDPEDPQVMTYELTLEP